MLHGHGFIHRDVKARRSCSSTGFYRVETSFTLGDWPQFDNMVLTKEGHLKLLDFGATAALGAVWSLRGLCRADPSAAPRPSLLALTPWS